MGTEANRQRNREKYAAYVRETERAARLKSQWAREKERALVLIGKRVWNEADHPRGQPGNAGQFGPGGGGGESESAGAGGGGSDKRKEGETDKEFAKRVVDKRPAPKELPEKHDDYFKNMDGPKTQIIPLSKLVSSKSAEENKKGGDNGAKRMVAGKNGEIAKRDPINAEPTGDGKYLITDGNGTYTTVEKYGWKAIPVNVDASGTAQADANMRTLDLRVNPKGRVGLKAEGKKASAKQRDSDDGWVKTSPIKTQEEAIAAALVTQNNFQAVAGPLAKRLGVRFDNPGSKVHQVKKETVNGEEEVVHDADGNPVYVKDADGKVALRQEGVKRLAVKAKKYFDEKKLGPARVTDLARGAFILERPEDAQKIMKELAKSFELVDEGWDTKGDTFYTDRVALFRDPATGMIGEIQFSQKTLLDAKQGGGHDIYKKREVEQAAINKAADRSMHAIYLGSATEFKRQSAIMKAHEAEEDRLNAQMRDLYGAALDKLSPEWRALIDGRPKKR